MRGARTFLRLPAPLLLLVSTTLAWGHPIPDLPVRSHFNDDGSAEIRVEVDPRSFLDDPEAEEFLTKAQIDALTEEEVREMKVQAGVFVGQRLSFFFEPLGEVRPKFTWEFQKLGDKGPLAENELESEGVLVGSWKTIVLAGMTVYRLEALRLTPGKMGIPLNVKFLNFIGGQQVERYAVLFPGETSFPLDLTGLASNKAAVPPEDAVGVKADAGDWLELFRDEVRHGFDHVMPDGLNRTLDGWDHMLFVLGLFLMSRKWKPLVFQVSAFTVAHTLTLWLGAVGVFAPSPKIVEPIIAASIVVIALENIFHKKYTHWRLLIVFVFGLIHGLAFAGDLAPDLESNTALIIGLLGVNIGVECAQLTIIAVALLGTFWITNQTYYRRFVLLPGSILIAVAGICWLVERTML